MWALAVKTVVGKLSRRLQVRVLSGAPLLAVMGDTKHPTYINYVYELYMVGVIW